MPLSDQLSIVTGIILADATTGAVALDIAPQPAIITWSRLEALPYNEDFTPGLQAEIADPLWMLARQWQFAEFQGEDAGTPIWSKLDGELVHLHRYQPGHDSSSGTSIAYEHLQAPLEVVVEQEEVRSQHPRLAAEAGEHFLRLLAAEGIPNARPILRAAFPLDINADELASHQVDPAGHVWHSLFANRAIDGSELAKKLRGTAPGNALTALPNELQPLADLDLAAALAAANRWLTWYGQQVVEPQQPTESAWLKNRLEYAFKLAAKVDNQEIVLSAPEYTDGELDWHSFRVDSGTSLVGASDEGRKSEYNLPPLLPAPVRYSGMPADRYWEFEDAVVNLGRMEAGPTDLARMVLAEFGLVFSNDWFVIPVEIPVGSLFRIKSLKVRDTFGETVDVKPARNFDGARWTMFSLTGTDELPDSLQDFFFLPPTLSSRLEGDPIEEVRFLRDEMANMAWAVEHKVQGASGLPMDRRMEVATGVHQRVDVKDIEAELIYRLQTPVADNWYPMVAVPLSANQSLDQFDTALELRTLLRTVSEDNEIEIHPKGTILGDESPVRLFEEEVPREGAKVERTFQYTRWFDGRRFLWVGRRKTAGRGEGSSGLRFDIANFSER